MTSKLDALDAKTGHTHTVRDAARVREKVRDAPATVTEDDFTILEYFGSAQDVADARAARELALHPRAPEPADDGESKILRRKDLRGITAAIARFVQTTLGTVECDVVKFPELLEDQRREYQHGVVNSLNPVYNRLDAIDRLMADVERRLGTLESQPVVKDCGTWTHGVTYHDGAIVSHGGSAWICRSTHYSTGDEPDHRHFRLFVKRGRDAPRDAR